MAQAVAPFVPDPMSQVVVQFTVMSLLTLPERRRPV
jgi:hypothetical protein